MELSNFIEKVENDMDLDNALNKYNYHVLADLELGKEVQGLQPPLWSENFTP